MKKVLIVLLVLIAIIAIGVTVFFGKLDGLIKEAIETEGTAALGSQVTVGAVETDLLNGKAVIDSMAIANVAGYQAPFAIKINKLQADVDYQNQLIEEILIEEPIINAELKGTRSNFQDLIANMPAATEPAAEEPVGDSPVITIKAFKLNRATVNLLSDQLGSRSFVMDDLALYDLVGTPEQISETITMRLTNHISSQVSSYAAQELQNRVKDEVKKRVESEVNEKVNEALQDKLGDKLKGLKLKLGSN